MFSEVSQYLRVSLTLDGKATGKAMEKGTSKAFRQLLELVERTLHTRDEHEKRTKETKTIPEAGRCSNEAV